jgi:hypothetical protein
MGLPTEMWRDLIRMATPRRQDPLDSQGARTLLNSERRTDLIQLVTKRSLPGDDDLALARPTLNSRHWGDDTGVILRRRQPRQLAPAACPETPCSMTQWDVPHLHTWQFAIT